jgi:hypothetical protein
VVVAVLLAGAAVAVARADYRVLELSFDMILPAEFGGAGLLAFSVVALTAGVGILAHCVQRPVHVAICALTAFLLVGTQAVTAYSRTRQLEEARAVVDRAAPVDDGALVIAGQQPATATSATVRKEVVIDAFGPALSAGIAGLLGAAQLLLAWGVVLLGGSAVAWFAATPVLLLLAAPWVLLRALMGPEVKAGVLALVSAFFGIFDASKSAVARLAPPNATAEAHEYRQQRRRRAIEAELEDAELAGAARLRGDLEAGIRVSESAALSDFLNSYSAARSSFFRGLLDEALRKAKAGMDPLPEYVVNMWNWPLKKVWRLLVVISGERGLNTRVGAPVFTSSPSSDLASKEEIQ